MVVSTIMEIYDWDTLTPFELNRQKNIIRNYEFMKACGKLLCKELVALWVNSVNENICYFLSGLGEWNND